MVEKTPINEDVLKHLEDKINSSDRNKNTVSSNLEQTKVISREPEVRIGYMEIFMEQLPTRKMFYPSDARLFIRAAQGTEIVTWSMIDEKDPLSVSEGLNSILSSCIEYIPVSGRKGSWKDLKEEDRLAIILWIRDVSMPEPENRLKSSTTCMSTVESEKVSCPVKEIELKTSNLETLWDDTVSILKYYDPVRRIYDVKTKQGDFLLAPPSLGIMEKVSEYVSNLRKKGTALSKDLLGFINFLPYMELDWRNLHEKRISELQLEYMDWTKTKPRKIQVLLSLIEQIKMGPTLKLKTTCEKCGAVVKAPVSFRRGLKDLFLLSDIDSELC